MSDSQTISDNLAHLKRSDAWFVLTKRASEQVDEHLHALARIDLSTSDGVIDASKLQATIQCLCEMFGLRGYTSMVDEMTTYFKGKIKNEDG